MRIEIYNVYSQVTEVFEGDEAGVREQIDAKFSFLARARHTTLDEDIEKLGRAQAYFVKVERS